ncbi:MAG: AAA family ATPase [Peptococcaceae bacterium]|jgi:chromosome segregation protein|nr:AAA family ATPase [Peptococcaceae bacterium]
MFLEQVSIDGFKSYATETLVAFKSGIAVVVGNNGVGKSNILDAVTWALGENNLDRLRIGGWEDLLFGGTREYPPATAARVTLLVKHGAAQDAPGTSIARVKYRSGAECYLVGEKEYGFPSFLQELAAMGLRDAVQTLVRQERINELIGLAPRERAAHVAGLLGSLERIGEVARDFQNFLQVLVPQGTATLILTEGSGDPELVVEASLGKQIRNAAALSGGERSVCSLALTLALFARLNSPFYLLDEVEASLDWTNHKNMQGLLKLLAREKQLIMVTHLRSTIQLADSLHGVRARKDGSSFVKYYFEMNERLLKSYKCC